MPQSPVLDQSFYFDEIKSRAYLRGLTRNQFKGSVIGISFSAFFILLLSFLVYLWLCLAIAKTAPDLLTFNLNFVKMNFFRISHFSGLNIFLAWFLPVIGHFSLKLFCESVLCRNPGDWLLRYFLFDAPYRCFSYVPRWIIARIVCAAIVHNLSRKEKRKINFQIVWREWSYWELPFFDVSDSACENISFKNYLNDSGNWRWGKSQGFGVILLSAAAIAFCASVPAIQTLCLVDPNSVLLSELAALSPWSGILLIIVAPILTAIFGAWAIAYAHPERRLLWACPISGDSFFELPVLMRWRKIFKRLCPRRFPSRTLAYAKFMQRASSRSR